LPSERIPLRGSKPGRREAGRTTVVVSRGDLLEAAWAQAERRYCERGEAGSPAFVMAVQTLALAWVELWFRPAPVAMPLQVAAAVVAAHRVPHCAIAANVTGRALDLCNWYILEQDRPEWLPADWEGRQ
jgi:hypothetical protein